jgi:hypothetical protein
VGTGAGLTWMKVSAADRTVATRIWHKPSPEETRKAEPPKRTGDSLALKLLPVPEHYALGPDIAGHGNDAEFSGKQAVALMKDGMDTLPREQRRQQSKAIDKLRVRGLGMRSYVSDSNDLVMETEIAQMADKKAVHDLSILQSKVVRAFKVFPKGPKIKEHANAHCFLAPKDPKAELDTMFCTAYEEDLLISMTAYGTKPLDTKAAAQFVRDQLDYVTSPGEYV